jgi:hypothetical protein
MLLTTDHTVMVAEQAEPTQVVAVVAAAAAETLAALAL